MGEDEKSTRHRVDQTIMIINALSNTIRQLSLSALDLQAMALSKKHQMEAAVDRVDDLGDVLDEYIALLKELTNEFFDESGYKVECK